ncbi:MAG: acetyl-CoA synthetase [Thermoleophilaceae bacterium]|jgi:acetyl-CoA synthetase|nr:acetyl-CoA synthetase [Thermoleophilaceae bacterium]
MAEEVEPDLEVLLKTEDTFPPPDEFAQQANAGDPSIYDEADKDFEGWWERWAKELDWFEEWQTVLDWDPPWAKWFKEGKLNVSHNCLDRHVEAGKGDKVAYHWIGEDDERRDVTYAELLEMTQRFANGLKELGVEKGDVVGIYMPMIPETPAAMLACARIGATHNVVFGGFSAQSVKERMEVSDAKVLVTCNTSMRRGKPMPMKSNVDDVVGDLPKLQHVVVVKRTDDDCEMQDGRDVWWHELCERVEPDCPAEPLDAEHPLYILYTSGSTAKPKGILHTTGGYLTGVYATTKLVFDLKPDSDVYWCAADIGWVTGHSYIVYGPLANGITSVMYEGAPDYPDKDRWWQIVEEQKVTIMYTAPTAIRACIKWGREYPEKHDLSSLRLLGSVGEPINPKAWIWYHKVIGGERCPIVDTWWQTETGHIMITPLPGITETKPGSATRAFPGVEAAVVDKDGKVVEEGGGFLTLRRPWPGMARTLFKEDDRYVETYWNKWGKDVYVVGDAARIDEDGYFWIVGRTDDVINVSGHRLSTMEVESAIVSHDRVAEAAVIGQQDEDTGQAIVAFVTLEGGAKEGEDNDSLDKELREHVAQKIGKLARPKRLIYADDLPKTRSGKIMRRLLRDIAEGRELGDVTTLRDPAVTEMIQERMGSGAGDE